MSQFCRPELYVAGEQIYNVSDVKFSEKGGSAINSLSVTLTDPELEEYKWYNQKVEFYLNYGTVDSVPLFRGYVRQINPSENKFSFTAMDPRTFLTGKESLPLNLNDFNNYDGYTLSQFIYKHISDNININDTIIGLDMLNDTNPPTLLKGRRDSGDAYKFITGNLPTNSSSVKKPYRYTIKMVEGNTHSNITINKDRDIADAVATEFSYENGISKISYKRRASPNIYNIKTKNKSISYQKGNLPTGPVGGSVKGDFEDTDTARKSAILDSIIKEDEIQEVNVTVTKGHYLSTGNIIRLNVEDTQLRKLHRIKSRNVSWSLTKGVTTQLILNKDLPMVSDYIQ